MRLWTLHPKYLDTKGLVALWREGLGAQRNILGLCGKMPLAKGYNNHPQLKRFMKSEDPIRSIGFYLSRVYAEACERGFSFNSKLIHCSQFVDCTKVQSIKVTSGQVLYESYHLWQKLYDRKSFKESRVNIRNKLNNNCVTLEVHNIFKVIISDKREEWEVVEAN